MSTTTPVTLTPSQRALVELIAHGWLAPLDGFMSRAEQESVERAGRLPGTEQPFPCAVTLAIPRAALPAHVQSAGGSDRPRPDSSLSLRDADGTPLGRVDVEDVTVRGDVMQIGGRLSDLRLRAPADFPALRGGPAAAKRAPVLVYQPGHFLHRGLEAGLRAAADRLGAAVHLQLLVAPRDEQPLAHFSRVAAICASAEAMASAGAPGSAQPGRASPGGALPQVTVLDVPDDLHPDAARRLRTWLAACAGATHLAVAPATAVSPSGPSKEDARDRAFAAELGLELVELPEIAELPALEAALAREGSLPEGTLGPDVARAVAHAWPPRAARGFTVFLTGLSGAGKSTIAHHLRARLMERTGREVTLLDGDLVRRHLSSELGFTREHRDLNIRRIGAVAAEITRHRGITICAPIAPYDATRRHVRQTIASVGGFVLVHVATPVEVCEARDTKGLYARARAGEVPHFTGVSDPYEAPTDAEVVIDAERLTPRDASEAVLRHLEREGYIPPEARP